MKRAKDRDKWRRLREQVIARDKVCSECGGEANEVHHIARLGIGGSRYRDSRRNTIEVLELLCGECHKARTASSGNKSARLLAELGNA